MTKKSHQLALPVSSGRAFGMYCHTPTCRSACSLLGHVQALGDAGHEVLHSSVRVVKGSAQSAHHVFPREAHLADLHSTILSFSSPASIPAPVLAQQKSSDNWQHCYKSSSREHVQSLQDNSSSASLLGIRLST